MEPNPSQISNVVPPEQPDASLEEKKLYLVKEIEAKDREAFFEYCLVKKGKNSDLATWEMIFLKEAVKEYQEIIQKRNELTNQIDKIDNEKKSFFKSTTLNNKTENLKTSLPCRMANKNQLNSTPNLDIIVLNPNIVETGMFSSNYVTYDVATAPLGWLVKRRFTDFETLRSLLIKNFPGHSIPPLPNKKMAGRRFDDDHINKRIAFLIKFMNSVISNELFRTSDIIINFLSQADRNIYDKKTREFLNKNPPIYIDEFYSMTGDVQLNYDPDNDKHFANINDFLILNSKIMGDVNFHFKKFDECIKGAYLSMDQIQKHFTYLSALHKKMNVKESYSMMYDEADAFTRQYKKILFKQSQHFETDIKEFLKYLRLENENLSEIIGIRDEIRDRYVIERKKLESKKEKLWTNGDFTKWEFAENLEDEVKVEAMKSKDSALKHMCFKESNFVNELYYKLGFFNRRCKEEFKILIDSQYNRTKKSFNFFLENIYPTLTEGITIWSNFSMNLSILE